MIRLLAAGTRIALVAVAMAMSIPVITFAQTPESAIESIPTEEAVASEVAASLADDENSTEDNTSVETNPPARSTIPSEVEAENQRLINELRSELLDSREKLVDWWLAALAVVLGFFAIVAVVGGYIAFTRFREIEAEAKNSVATAKQHETATEDIRRRVGRLLSESEEQVQRIRNLTAEAAANDPTKANLTVKDIFENPKASLTDKVIADALDLQQQGRNKEAIEKWQVIASIAEGTDNDLAARAWFSVGYLLQGKTLERSISAYNKAIRLKPDFAKAYNNRGKAKAVSGLKDEARKDFEIELELARNANNANIVAQVEQSLLDLDAAKGS